MRGRVDERSLEDTLHRIRDVLNQVCSDSFCSRERTVLDGLDRGRPMADKNHAAQAKQDRAALGIA